MLPIQKELQSLTNPEKAIILQHFFKTGHGEYGEGDIFLGIQVPHVRTISKKYLNLSYQEISILLNSKIHEERLVALLILIEKFNKSRKDNKERRRIYEFYLSQRAGINNWDLVDLSADKIVGEFIFNEDKSILRDLARSKNLWERRIAIVSTFAFIRRKRFGETLAISEILINDTHDLIHKAVGWMLREVGKRDQEILEIFLKTHYNSMPRTMLRYSIEKFPQDKRKAYLKGEI
ncbi:MAG: DNA alkylation repair protein [Nanoarchaeota archaeon]|nr:DNA alkylation repair protein [Nanoarchaeota archaeon]